MAQKRTKNSKKKQKYNSPAPAPSAFWTRWLPLILFIAVAVLIFYPPFFRGLFFKEDMFITHIITGIIFIAVWVEKIYRHDYRFLHTPLDWVIFAYAGTYLLALIGAVHPGDAMYGFLRVLNYFMVYWLLTQVVKNYRDYENILRVLLAAGVGVAAIGILAAVGLSQYPSAFDGRVILSTLQYPNTTAAYLAVLTIVGLTLWVKEQNLTRQIIYAIANFLMILVVLCSLSKGAWLIFVVGLIILLIGLPGIYRWKSFYGMGFMFVSAALVYSKFFPAIQGNEGRASDLLLILLGLLIVLIGQLLWQGLEALFRRKGLPLLVGSLVLLCVIGIGGLFWAPGSDAEPLLNESVKNELTRFTDFTDTSWVSRADFNRWGWAIVKDHPIIGTGAGGWNALYHQYQDYQAWTTEVHNHFMQVWVEAGTLGLLAFLAIWISFIMIAIRTHRRLIEQMEAGEAEASSHLIMLWGTFAGALALGIHAAMDFDLSLSAISMLLWTLFALVNQMGSWEGVQTDLQQLKLPAWADVSIAVVLAFVIIITGSCYASAHSAATRAADHMQKLSQSKNQQEQVEHLRQAALYYEKANSLDNNDAGYKADLANIYTIVYEAQVQQQGPQAAPIRQRIIELVQQGEKIAPYDTKVRNSLLNTCAKIGDVEGMIRQAEGALQANPYQKAGYTNLINTLSKAMEYYQENKQIDQARECAVRLLKVEEQIEQQNQRMQPGKGEPLALSGADLSKIARAAYLMGDYSRAVKTLAPYTDNLLAAEFSDWDFEATSFENENWKAHVVHDPKAHKGKCVEFIAKKDQHGWPTVLPLAEGMEVEAGKTYVTAVRYKIISCENAANGAEGPCIGLWGSVSGDNDSQNSSYAFYDANQSASKGKWELHTQAYEIPEGFNRRSYRLGTGSVSKGTVFRLDYIKVYPDLQQGVPANMIEPLTVYAAASYQLGKQAEADRIMTSLQQADPKVMAEYEKLLQQKPLK
ncbi:MAG TPA: hypothetical protein GX404_09320 [Syntrophomonadaceae bacterium]|nr:hypothetical protein [Syntrophomonadaceae bacterium]